jgi:hypothetical protein
MKLTETHKFRKGEKIHLDEIYAIQGLAGGQWWQREDGEDELSDDLIITETITITITVDRKANEKSPDAGATE